MWFLVSTPSLHSLFIPYYSYASFLFHYSADGNFEVTLATKATILDNGKVEWKPPAIYHSSCEMDVEYFPFDEQTCVMKFGSWTYDGGQVIYDHNFDNFILKEFKPLVAFLYLYHINMLVSFY